MRHRNGGARQIRWWLDAPAEHGHIRIRSSRWLGTPLRPHRSPSDRGTKQDLQANRQILLELGVGAEQIHLDRAYSGTNRARPGPDQALAAVRAGDPLVVPKLDRLARSVPDARHIGDSRHPAPAPLERHPPRRVRQRPEHLHPTGLSASGKRAPHRVDHH